MPINTDDKGKRWVEMAFVAPGTPEQVWDAMATGPGNTAWFTKASVDGRVGGEIQFDFGPQGTQTGEVTTWEPPHRFAYVEPNWSPGAPPVATEITITARSGDRCVIRMVHSLFASSDEWDDQIEGFEKGWPTFFGVLRLYLTHFAGRPAASFTAMVTVAGDPLPVWQRLVEQLGLAGADVGERRTIAAPVQPLSVAIEHVVQDPQQRYVTMRLEAPTPGIAFAGTYRANAQVIASATIYFYGEDASAVAAASEEKWRDWLATRLGSGVGELTNAATS
jgi:uncharacterized protein YndB with AHSA1/START domain